MPTKVITTAVRRAAGLSAACLLGLAGCGGGASAPASAPDRAGTQRTMAVQPADDAMPAWFGETTAAARWTTRQEIGYGAFWGDVNGDGAPDIWVSNHMFVPSLYENQRDGTFVQSLASRWNGDPAIDSHGGAWADVDNDGDQDLIVVAGADRGMGGGNKPYYVNEGGQLVNRADEFGLNDFYGRGRTPLWLDWNRDGRLDLYLANARRPNDLLSPAKLLLQGADGRFAELPEMSVQSDAIMAQLVHANSRTFLLVSNDDEAYPTGFYALGNPTKLAMQVDGVAARRKIPGKVRDAVVADFNNDLGQEILLLQTKQRDPVAKIVGDGTRLDVQVKDITQERGVTFTLSADAMIHLRSFGTRWRPDQIRLGAGAVASTARRTSGLYEGQFEYWTDLDLDPADPNVQGFPPEAQRTIKGLYIGRNADGSWQLHARGGAADGLSAVLTMAAERFTAVTPVNFGAGTVDIAKAPALLFFAGTPARFEDRAPAWGLPPTLSCFSGVAGDFDNDQDLDLYLACSGAVDNLPNRLFENVGGRFVEVPLAGGGATADVSTGGNVSMGDYDGDGWLDLLVTDGCSSCGAPWSYGRNTLLRNLNGQRLANHWVEFDLVGCTSNRDGIGARVAVYTPGTRQLRLVDGMHHAVQDHRRLHVGLGPNTTIDNVVVQWPSGAQTNVRGLAADRVHTLRESASCPRG